jgi:hypothetical protein
LQLCAKAGIVKLGHVAIDGTRIKANASKHKAIDLVAGHDLLDGDAAFNRGGNAVVVFDV